MPSNISKSKSLVDFPGKFCKVYMNHNPSHIEKIELHLYIYNDNLQKYINIHITVSSIQHHPSQIIMTMVMVGFILIYYNSPLYYIYLSVHLYTIPN